MEGNTLLYQIQPLAKRLVSAVKQYGRLKTDTEMCRDLRDIFVGIREVFTLGLEII